MTGFREVGLDAALVIGGNDVDVTDASAAFDATSVDVDPTVELVTYRIVQESLANVLQHAPGADAAVSIRVVDERLEVSVRNSASTRTPIPSTHTGLGTRGMAERARAVGGRFESASTADGGWAVIAHLPLRAADMPSTVTHA